MSGEKWKGCFIGSCHRHRDCMYTPCRSADITQHFDAGVGSGETCVTPTAAGIDCASDLVEMLRVQCPSIVPFMLPPIVQAIDAWANARLDKMAKWQHEIDMVALAGRDAQIARRDFFIHHAIDQLDKAATTAANSGQKAREYDCGPMNAAAGTLRNALSDGPLTHPYDGWRLVVGDDGALRVERVGDGR